jgi:DNA-binding NtrC family response regulator
METRSETLADEELVVPRTEQRFVLRWVSPELRDLPLECLGVTAVLGRDVSCDVRLSGNSISRRHAELSVSAGALTLRDLGSRNGTWVDGVRAAQAVLLAGSVVRLGDWVGVVLETDSDAAPLRELAGGFLGGPELEARLADARVAAESSIPVIIEGATGTGKERVARAIHEWSGRPGPFVAVNCAAIPEALAEAELFGYAKGAFTGSQRSTLGHLRSAHGGTLLLDEVVELSLPLQAKLLRVIETSEVQGLGESRSVSVDARFVVAAQQALRGLVAAGRFRADLYARLNGLTVRLPPLRERAWEVPLLFSAFLQRAANRRFELEAKLVERLCLHAWSGNVRELELLARRIAALRPHASELKRTDFPDLLDEPVSPADRGRPVRVQTEELSTTERDARDLAELVSALGRCQGNVLRASAQVGLSRQRAYRLIRAAEGLELSQFRNPDGKE